MNLESSVNLNNKVICRKLSFSNPSFLLIVWQMEEKEEDPVI